MVGITGNISMDETIMRETSIVGFFLRKEVSVLYKNANTKR